MSAITDIHDKLNQVFGGSNPMQFFTLMMPGMVLDRETYAYDLHGEKPTRVVEAESRLVNQLYDVCQVTGSGNGRHLASQYLQALSKLVPRLDPRMAEVKARLRAYLAEPYSTVLEDGTTFSGTRQEAYFTMYDAWVKRRLAWEQRQNDERKKLQDANPGNQAAVTEGLDRWFETVADAELMQVDAAGARVTTIIAPADMDAILGVLDSGVGGAIEEARRMVTDARQRSRAGGYAYPVELRPADWFDSLVSETAPEDLLDAPEYLALKLSARRDALRTTISQVQSLLAGGKDDELAALSKELSKAQDTYTSARRGLLTNYTDNLATAAEIFIAKGRKAPARQDAHKDELNELAKLKSKVDNASGKPAQTQNPATTDPNSTKSTEGESPDNKGQADQPHAPAQNGEPSGEAGQDGKPEALSLKADLEKIKAGQESLVQSQEEYLGAAQKLVEAARKLSTAQASTYVGLQPYLARLQQQATDLDTLWNQIGTAANRTPTEAPTGKAGDHGAQRSGGSDRFLDLTFSFAQNSMTQESTLQASASQTSWNVSAFLGSAEGADSSSSSASTQNMVAQGTTIEIGLRAMRVDVDREWFDPGVFALTRDLDAIGETKIAKAPLSPKQWTSEAVLEQNKTILPCYPVSFIVAKDVTLKFKAEQSIFHAARQVADSQSAVGGGFACFSASGSQSSHGESQSVAADSESGVVTIHIRSPQVIGWFMEFVPEDHSTKVDNTDSDSIVQFIRSSELPAPAQPRALAPGAARVPAPAA